MPDVREEGALLHVDINIFPEEDREISRGHKTHIIP
jgi:hypothetical protein